jgi:ABC-type Fe3+-siderophore transport system permease subunit
MQIPEYVRRELSEVYLLMDHIAGQQDKSLDTALAPPGSNDDVIKLEQLCAVVWPVPDAERAKVLATVLMAKDRLSHAAYPATGLSVAFTYLSTSPIKGAPEDASFIGKMLRSAAYPALLVLGWLTGTMPEKKDTEAAHLPDSTIVKFAHDAFPGLESKRALLRRTIFRLVITLLFLLLITCSVTWDLAIGQRLLGDFKWLSQHPDVMEPAAGAKGAPNVDPTKIEPGSEQARLLARTRILPALQAWNCRQYGLAWFVGACQRPPADIGTADEQAQNMELARVLVTTLNYNVLPLLLGALAATAAAVRMIAKKVQGNELAPWDLRLVLPRVALGAFLGAVIGLLIAPAESNGLFALVGANAANNGAANANDTVALSPAAYAFLAGFATNRIFQWLDNLVDRIFHFANPKP